MCVGARAVRLGGLVCASLSSSESDIFRIFIARVRWRSPFYSIPTILKCLTVSTISEAQGFHSSSVISQADEVRPFSCFNAYFMDSTKTSRCQEPNPASATLEDRTYAPNTGEAIVLSLATRLIE